MASKNIGSRARRSTDTQQMTLQFEPGLSQRFPSLRECIATGIYQRGLSNVAPALNKAPGNLSVELSEDPSRNFSVDNLEKYIAEFGDLSPIYYLVEKFVGEPAATDQAALSDVMQALQQVQAAMRRAGLA